MVSENVPAPADGVPMPRRWLAIAAVSFGTALVAIDGTIVNVALPTIAHDLGVDSAGAVLVVTVYQLVLLMTLLPFSTLGDRVGHRALYQWGQLAFTIATLLCFFARSLPFLLVVRAVQGLGAAAVLSVSSALIRSIYPRHQLGRGLAVNSVIVSSSSAAAPTAGGFILTFAPWPWVFAAAVPFALLSLVLGRALPDSERHSKPYDLLGAVLCAATFGLTISGLESAVQGDSPVISAAIVVTGLLVGVLFVRRELREPRPILPVDLLATPLIGLASAGALTAFVGSMALMLSVPFRLEHEFGFSPSQVGAALAAWPLTMMVAGPAAGALSDRIHAGVLGGIGMAIAIGGTLSLAFLPPDIGYADVAWRMGLCGLGFGLYLVPIARLIIGASPHHRAASAGGLTSTIRLTGQTVGATLAAALLATGLASRGAPALVACALALVAGLCGLVGLTLRQPAKRPDAELEVI